MIALRVRVAVGPCIPSHVHLRITRASLDLLFFFFLGGGGHKSGKTIADVDMLAALLFFIFHFYNAGEAVA
jgi:hypothetical protein